MGFRVRGAVAVGEVVRVVSEEEGVRVEESESAGLELREGGERIRVAYEEECEQEG